MKDQNVLARSIRFALLSGLSLAITAPAFAQEEETLEDVVVTGSRISRSDSETASPVLLISQEAIQATGAATIGEFIQEVPSIAGAGTNPQVNNGGGDGAARVSLRGLGTNRTLVLINGRRFKFSETHYSRVCCHQSDDGNIIHFIQYCVMANPKRGCATDSHCSNLCFSCRTGQFDKIM